MSDRPSPARRSLPHDHYFLRSQQPLQSLVFLFPLILVYEIGALYFTKDPATGRPISISAYSFLQDFLKMFGAVSTFMPGLAVVVILLAWHIARRDRWRLYPKLYLGMSVESITLAIPLLMFGLLVGPRHAAAAGVGVDPATLPWKAWVVLSIGAGVYEELVFRLAAIAVLHMAFVDALGVPEKRGAILSVVCSAVLFAAYHFSDGSDFETARFVYYFAAGIYFAVIYVMRGFGIVAATHAAYDLLIFAIMQDKLPAR